MLYFSDGVFIYTNLFVCIFVVALYNVVVIVMNYCCCYFLFVSVAPPYFKLVKCFTLSLWMKKSATGFVSSPDASKDIYRHFKFTYRPLKCKTTYHQKCKWSVLFIMIHFIQLHLNMYICTKFLAAAIRYSQVITKIKFFFSFCFISFFLLLKIYENWCYVILHFTWRYVCAYICLQHL